MLSASDYVDIIFRPNLFTHSFLEVIDGEIEQLSL